MARETGKIPSIEEMQDRLAIMEVLAIHSRGIDRLDLDSLKSAYWPDAEVAYGTFNGKAYDFAVGVMEGLKAFERTAHTVTNTAFSFRGDEARVESHVTAYHYSKADPDTEMTFVGRYLDRMEKRGDVWKIAHRRVVHDWNQNVPATADWGGDLFPALTQGARLEGGDALYQHLK